MPLYPAETFDCTEIYVQHTVAGNNGLNFVSHVRLVEGMGLQ